MPAAISRSTRRRVVGPPSGSRSPFDPVAHRRGSSGRRRAGLAQLLEPPRTSRSSVWPRMARGGQARGRGPARRRAHGPVHADHERDRGDETDHGGKRRRAGRRADVIRRPGADRGGAGRGGDRLPPQGRRARGRDPWRPGRGPRGIAAGAEGCSRASGCSGQSPRASAERAGARGARVCRTGSPEQVDCSQARDQREDRQGAPDRIYGQLGLTGRTQAALWAKEHGLD